MKAIVRLNAVIVLTSMLLTGCWSHYELTDLVFVMGVAIDTNEDGTVRIMTQYYKPKGGKDSSQGGGDSNLNVVTTGDSVFPAIRNITGELGRRSQWSHMRVVLISEETARRTDIGDLLDIFYRDPEPRLTASILITKGKAATYLNMKPFIEQTTSQQIMRSQEALYRYAARTVESNLLEVAKQRRGKTGNAVIAYIAPYGEKSFRVSGSALFKKDKMIDKLTGDEHDGYLMLIDRYKRGLINLPCSDADQKIAKNEIVEITDYSSKLTYRLIQDQLVVSVHATANASARELKCTAINTVVDEHAYKKKIEHILKEEMSRSFAILQKKKLDILSIGNRVFQKNEKLWNKLEPDWDNYFSHARLESQVRIILENTGTAAGKPVFSE